MSTCTDCNGSRGCRELRGIPGVGGDDVIGQQAPSVMQTTKLGSCEFDIVVHKAENSNVLPRVRVRLVDSCGDVKYDTDGLNLFTRLVDGVIEYRLRLDVTGILPRDGHYNVYVDVNDAPQPVFKVLRNCDKHRGHRCC